MEQKENYIFSKETYTLRGIFFELHNKLGSIHKEKTFCDGLEIEFKKYRVPYKREVRIDLKIEGQKIADMYLDFVVFDKIGIEVKSKRFFTQEDFRQTLRYAKTLNLPLILLVNFRGRKVTVKRIINTR